MDADAVLALSASKSAFFPMTWIPKHSIPFALVRRLLPCFCLAIFAVASSSSAEFTSSDSATLGAILNNLNSVSGWNPGQGYPALTYAQLEGFAEFFTDELCYQSNGVWYLRVSPTSGGDCKFSPYDDQWLKLFLTGRDDGSVSSAPKFGWIGYQPSSAQSLEAFLTATLGSFVDNRSSSDWNLAFTRWSPGTTPAYADYRSFTVWLAEAMRRLISTNQLIATTHDRNTRSIQENLSLILTQLRQMTNSVSVSSPDVSVTVNPVVDIPAVSVTNEVTIAADYAPSMPEIGLTNISGEVTAASYVAPDTSVFENELELSAGPGNSVLTLWSPIRLAGAGVPGGSMLIPGGQIDFNSSQYGGILRNCSAMLTRISVTIWWLLYYLALGVLLRREYVYYTSLGHTEGAA